MELVDLTLRLGGSMMHTVNMHRVSPAEILILRDEHGDDACVDIRPVELHARVPEMELWNKLAAKYDNSANFPVNGEIPKSKMQRLFPGALRALPKTLQEIGLGHLVGGVVQDDRTMLPDFEPTPPLPTAPAGIEPPEDMED